MSNFKKGDLVEVIGSLSHPELIGSRFNLTKVYALSLGEFHTGRFWDSPFKNSMRQVICFREDHLKKVNPDGENLSEFTFDELINDLRYSKQQEKTNEYE